jgi:phosphonate degradation associated HDIG domain protein
MSPASNPDRIDDVVQQVGTLLDHHGDSQYGGEVVTQREHALQSAWLAEQAGAAPALIAAALLHDIGHLLHHLPNDAPDRGIDDRHEELGARWLRKRFPDAVIEPVRLHVPAKRYLAATDPVYPTLLSEPSIVSLRLQGGPMSPGEVEEFEQHPHFTAAVELRRWDDTAKIAGLQTPSVSHFLSYVRTSLTATAN